MSNITPKLIEAEIQAGNWKEAKADVDQVLKDHPDSARAHLLKAYILEKQGDTAGSQQEFSQIISLDKTGDTISSPMYKQLTQEYILMNSHVHADGGFPWAGVGITVVLVAIGVLLWKKVFAKPEPKPEPKIEKRPLRSYDTFAYSLKKDDAFEETFGTTSSRSSLSTPAPVAKPSEPAYVPRPAPTPAPVYAPPPTPAPTPSYTPPPSVIHTQSGPSLTDMIVASTVGNVVGELLTEGHHRHSRDDEDLSSRSSRNRRRDRDDSDDSNDSDDNVAGSMAYQASYSPPVASSSSSSSRSWDDDAPSSSSSSSSSSWDSSSSSDSWSSSDSSSSSDSGGSDW